MCFLRLFTSDDTSGQDMDFDPFCLLCVVWPSNYFPPVRIEDGERGFREREVRLVVGRWTDKNTCM